jgi:very-short-patch-repair endonuclease
MILRKAVRYRLEPTPDQENLLSRAVGSLLAERDPRPSGQGGCQEQAPQEKLWAFVQQAWPGQAELDFRLPIAGRKFEADIAFVQKKLAIEVDGWHFHGKRYKDFVRDREKSNGLASIGWTLLRFPAMDVQYKFQQVVNTIQATLVRLR